MREFALQALVDDLARMEYTPNQLFNMHPGSHTGQGSDIGIEQIAETLNQVITPDQTTTLLLETMAGKGSEVGSTFEEIAAIRAFASTRATYGMQGTTSRTTWTACSMSSIA